MKNFFNFANLVFVSVAKAILSVPFTYLGSVNSSPKLKKNGTVSMQNTYGLYLAPHKLSGYNTCPNSTPECRKGCLYASGHTAMEIISGRNCIQNARINKTRMLFENQEFFMNWLVADIRNKQKTATKKGFGFSVRLNCTSDIDWANVRLNGLNIFETFPNVQFYDYTKSAKKFINKPDNYHLTMSYTGRNWKTCKILLDEGHNVAMVFNVQNETDIPAMYDGYKVINGDITDYRVTDGKGVIVGLKWKRIADKEAEQYVLNSCFVVDPVTSKLAIAA